MVMTCDLEVDVNGEEIFLVSKDILSSFSGRLRKLFDKPSLPASSQSLKVILHNLPGSAEGFELMTRFCYSNGRIHIAPSNVCLLHCVAEYMEMTKDASPNLIKITEKCLEEIPFWTWLEIMNSLKQCQGFLPAAIASGNFDKILDSLAVRITTASDNSPTSSSPESSAFRFSFDTRSTISTKSSSQRTWWFDDLALLDPDMIQKVISNLIFRKIDNVMISRFLFHYLKSGVCSAPSKKRKATEIVIDLLYSLDRNCISCKGLFGILRVSLSLRLIKSCQSRLESMIGTQIDQATLDSLLIPAPIGMESHYDVSLVLRFLNSFLATGVQPSSIRMKRVGSLIDSYLVEVAPDSSLEPSKFISLITILPDAARDSHDAVYQAVDLYLEVHTQLSEEEKMNICCAIDYDKLSSESCKHLARNPKFPSRTAVEALTFQQSKLKSLLQNTDSFRSILNPPPNESKCKEKDQLNDSEQIVLYANKLDLTLENEKLKAELQGMQWRVMELEKICRKMQTRMAKVMKNKTPSPSGSRSLPRLCS
ncbi:BTB/POZ domain-containing protein [Canna indica]|uniref:BTB/POZ domain-containing protein n=1 Tax=Canna indica TaxID=4628 RepID=A0AAQ3QGN7_9LILI|nr:BTB/POZ domain-containing protein [Canna indica]